MLRDDAIRNKTYKAIPRLWFSGGTIHNSISQQIGTLSGMHRDGQFDAASREQKIYHGSESLALDTQLEVIFTCRCQFLHLNI